MRAYASTLLFIVCACSACAGLNPSGPSAATFTGTDAQNLAKNFASGATNGASAGNRQASQSAGLPLPAVTWNSLLQPKNVTCNSTGTSCQIFQQYSQTTTCDGGGRISASGTISGSLSNGNLGLFGNISLQQTDSVVDWGCEGGWTVNGDPRLSDTGTIAITGNHTSFSFRQTGGLQMVSTTDGTRVSCNLNSSVQWDNTALGGSFSGTMACSPGGTFSVSGSF